MRRAVNAYNLSVKVVSLFFLPAAGSGRRLLRVATATVSIMLSQQPELATRHLIQPLLQPLPKLVSGTPPEGVKVAMLAGELEICIQNLQRVLNRACLCVYDRL